MKKRNPNGRHISHDFELQYISSHPNTDTVLQAQLTNTRKYWPVEVRGTKEWRKGQHCTGGFAEAADMLY